MTAIPPPPQFSAAELGPRCLVVGGGGYVGGAIVARLRACGCQVRSFDVVPHEHGGDVEILTGDLRDPAALQAACEGIDTIFHTAALIKIIEIARPALRRQVFEVNARGTENVVRAAQAAGVKALVHTSTFSVVLDRELDDKDESLPYATRSRDLYTLSKIEAEKIALGADQADGLRVCALRPGGVWGPDARSVMIRGFLDQLDGFKVLIGDGHATMDNTHLQNLVDAQLLGARGLRANAGTVGGQAYFITDEEPLNALEWFRPLVESLGRKFPSRRLPGKVMVGVGRLMELAHYLGGPEPLLTPRAVRNLTESSSFRIDKARRELGYEPRYNRINGMPEVVGPAREYLASRSNARSVAA